MLAFFLATFISEKQNMNTKTLRFPCKAGD